MDLIITVLPVVTTNLSISPRFTPYDFLSRCKFSNLTTRQPMVEFYLLTFPRFPLRKKEPKSYFGKNRTQDFRASKCAGYLLDHSGYARNGDRWGTILNEQHRRPTGLVGYLYTCYCGSREFDSYQSRICVLSSVTESVGT